MANIIGELYISHNHRKFKILNPKYREQTKVKNIYIIHISN